MKIACRFRGRGLDLEDLIGEETFGLIRAAQIADPNSGCWFHTYAAYWIEKAIRQALNRTARPMVYIPVETMQLMRIDGDGGAGACGPLGPHAKLRGDRLRPWGCAKKRKWDRCIKGG